jgi:5-hydroxyisourate hydrolase
MSPLTTHVLDTHLGRPAAGVGVTLEKQESSGQWRSLATAATNDDGRIPDLLASGALTAGRHRLTFETGAYFDEQHVAHFYPRVAVEFEITAPEQHYHVPLLLSPFGYSTYRGS